MSRLARLLRIGRELARIGGAMVAERVETGYLFSPLLNPLLRQAREWPYPLIAAPRAPPSHRSRAIRGWLSWRGGATGPRGKRRVPRCKRAFGHVSSTLAIAALAWIVGVAASQRFGRAVDTTASMALVGLGAWIALSSWNDRRSAANAHPHDPIHPRRHEHEAPDHNAKSRPALLLILGSSPMFEGSPPSLLRPDMARRCWSR